MSTLPKLTLEELEQLVLANRRAGLSRPFKTSKKALASFRRELFERIAEAIKPGPE